MKGVVYPEITSMNNAEIGGYLSDAALAELNNFKTRVERLKYVVEGVQFGQVTLNASNHTYSENLSVPAGYTPVGVAGVSIDNLQGTAPHHCCVRGELTTSTKVYLYYSGGTYSDGSGRPYAHILYRRSS